MPIKLDPPKNRYVLTAIKGKSMRTVRVLAYTEEESISIAKEKYPGHIISVLREVKTK